MIKRYILQMILAILITAFLTSKFQLTKTSGTSMYPTITNNQFVLCRKLGFNEKLKEGDIAIYLSNKGGLVAHRIIYVTPKGYIFKGDHNVGYDDFVPQEKVRYKVILY